MFVPEVGQQKFPANLIYLTVQTFINPVSEIPHRILMTTKKIRAR